jgi:uncharacterized delta-60 repeat protein
MKRSLYTFYLLLFSTLYLGAQPKVLDDLSTLITRPANIQAVAEQADGKILLGGTIRQVNSLIREDIVRLNPNGQPDPSFQVNIGDTVITTLALQNDQKILAGGYIRQNDQETGILFRLFSDGSIDPSFQVDTFNNRVLAIEYLDNDRIVVGGIFRTYGTQPSSGLLMLNANGSIFRTFSISEGSSSLFVNAILEVGGQFYIGGNVGSDAQLLRYSNTGQLDNSFTIDESVGMKNFMTVISHIDQLSNGNIVFTTYTWEFDPRVVVVTPTGQRVSSVSIPNPLGLTVTNQDQILISGEWNGRPDAHLVTNGSLTPFIPGAEADDQVLELITLSSGNVLVTGRFGTFKGLPREGIALLNPNRTISNDFQTTVKRSGQVNQAVHLASGKVLIGGDFTQVNGNRIINLARLNSDGSLDNSFQPTAVPSDKEVRTIQPLSNGKIMVGTSASSLDPNVRPPIFRLNNDGSLDNTFQISNQINILGNIKGFVPLLDGRIVAYGAFSLLTENTLFQQIALFNTNGSFDPLLSSAFQGGTINDVYLRGSELLVVGSSIRLGNLDRVSAVAVDLAGVPTNTFSTTLDNRSRIESMIALSDGDFLLSGRLFDGLNYRELMRVNGDGSRDNSFIWPIFSTEEAPTAPPRDMLELGNGDLVLTNLTREEEREVVIIDARGTVKETFSIDNNARYVDLEAIDDSTAYLSGAFFYQANQSSLLKVQFYGSMDNNSPVDTTGQNMGGPAFLVEGGNTQVGETVCVSVSADDLEGILGIQLEIDYNPGLLNFDRLENLVGLPGLTESDFGLPGNSNNPEGTIRLAWLDPALSGFSLTDTTTLFDLCFTAVAPSFGTQVQIVDTELINDQDQLVAAGTSAAPIVILPDDNPTDPDTLSVQLGSGTVQQGEVICIPVTVSDFDDIMGLQFNISYDSTKLQYQSLQNFNLPGLSLAAFGVPGTGANEEGRIKMAWFDMAVNGVNLPDQTVIFEVCFVALADAGSTTLSFSNVEVTKDVGESVRFRSTEGQVTFQMSDDPVQDPTRVLINNSSVRVGDVVCVPIRVEDFTDLIGMGFILNYDPTKLVFQSLGQFNLPNLNEDFFKLPGAGTLPLGQLEMTWFDFTEQGVSLSDQTVIFEACFLVVDDNGTTDLSFSDVVVIGSDSDPRPFQTRAGTFQLLPEEDQSGDGDFAINTNSLTTQVGEDICVQFTTENFTDIIGVQFMVSYDTSILTYESVENFNLTGLASSVGVPGQGNNPEGQLNVAWIDANLEGIDLPDGTVLFEMCFSAKAAGSSGLDFSDVEITGTVVNDIPFTGQSGIITVEGDNTGGTDYNNDNFTLVSSDITTSEGESFCLPIRVRDFDGIKELNFSYFFDPQLISYNTVINTALPGLSESIEVINTGSNNLAELRVEWMDETGAGISLPEEAILMEVCFTANRIGVSNVAFDNAMVVDANDDPVNFTGDNAFVTVEAGDDGGTNFFTLQVSSDTVAMGESFCLNVSIDNFANVLGVKLNIDYDPELLLFEGIQNFNLKGLDSRSFDLPGVNNNEPGRVKLSWIDQDLQGVTLEDGTVIFQICFQAIERNVVGTVSLSSPNILDVNGNVLNFVGIGAVVMIQDRMVTNTFNQEKASDRYRLYPVPTVGELNIASLRNGFAQTPFRIVDQRGAIVLQGELNDFQTRLSVHRLPNGRYNLIIFEDSRYWNLSFIKL